MNIDWLKTICRLKPICKAIPTVTTANGSARANTPAKYSRL
jgi:hypothetical protein